MQIEKNPWLQLFNLYLNYALLGTISTRAWTDEELSGCVKKKYDVVLHVYFIAGHSPMSL